jgi:hypothetical protein
MQVVLEGLAILQLSNEPRPGLGDLMNASGGHFIERPGIKSENVSLWTRPWTSHGIILLDEPFLLGKQELCPIRSFNKRVTVKLAKSERERVEVSS